MDAKTLQNRLLEELGVATVAGTSFGALGEGFIRFSYANSVENIKIALERIAWTVSLGPQCKRVRVAPQSRSDSHCFSIKARSCAITSSNARLIALTPPAASALAAGRLALNVLAAAISRERMSVI